MKKRRSTCATKSLLLFIRGLAENLSNSKIFHKDTRPRFSKLELKQSSIRARQTPVKILPNISFIIESEVAEFIERVESERDIYDEEKR